MNTLAPILQAFFTDRLLHQRNASPHTIAAYRDTMRLLLTFALKRTGKQPYDLDLSDLDAPLIGAFLEHLERERSNTVRTRTRGSRRFTPCSGSPRWTILRTPNSSNACWRSHQSAQTVHS